MWAQLSAAARMTKERAMTITTTAASSLSSSASSFSSSSASSQLPPECHATATATAGPLLLIWAYDETPDETLLQQAVNHLPQAPTREIKVFCGSNKCLEFFQDFVSANESSSSSSTSTSTDGSSGSTTTAGGGGTTTTTTNSAAKCMTVSRLLVPEMAQDTPLQDWVDQHVLAKLLAAHHYEDHLQVAMQLAALYKFGGTVIHLLHPAVLYQESLLLQVVTSLGASDAAAAAAAAAVGGGGVRSSSSNNNNNDDVLRVLDYNSSVVSSWGGLWGASVQTKHNKEALRPFVNQLLQAYKWDKPMQQKYDPNAWPVQFKFQTDGCMAVSAVATTTTTAQDDNSHCLVIRVPPSHGWQDISAPVSNKTFATLSYDARRTYLLSIGNPGMNLGDEMQGLAGLQFLPRLDAFVERDRLDVVRFTKDGNVTGSLGFKTPSTVLSNPHQKVHAFLNAWWGTPNMTWPPPSMIEPVTISMHFQPQVYYMIQRPKAKKFFEDNAPIGARDLKTLSVLTSSQVSVPALFTACMTMSLTLSPYTGPKEGILVVDVTNKEFLQKIVPANVLKTAKTMSHKVLGDVAGHNLKRYIGAFEKLMTYRQAKLVITERLHTGMFCVRFAFAFVCVCICVKDCLTVRIAHYFALNLLCPDVFTALPSIAMGTPVVFLDGGTLIGGGGSRLEGLERFMHYVRGNEKLPDNFDWSNPPDNPDQETFKRYSTTIKHLAACHSGITDSARKFGMVPETWDADRELELCSDEAIPNPNAIHIATVLDGKYLHTVFPSWVNALAKTNGDEELVLYVLTDNLSSKQHCLLRQIADHLLPASATVYTLPVEFSKKVIDNYRGLKHVPVATQARLYLPSLLPCVEKVLWVDLDALAVGSLRPLWLDTQIPECGLCARESVVDFFDNNNMTKAMQWNKKYGKSFNAGVMLLQLDSLRQQKFEATIVKYFGEQLGLNDQLVYNLACNGTYGRLPQAMNVYQQYAEEHTPPREDWVIAHFQSSQKPWAGAAVEEKFQKIWNTYKISFEEAIAVTQGPRDAIRDPNSVLLLPGAKIQRKNQNRYRMSVNRAKAIALLRKHRSKQQNNNRLTPNTGVAQINRIRKGEVPKKKKDASNEKVIPLR